MAPPYRASQGYWAQSPDHSIAHAVHQVRSRLTSRGAAPIINRAQDAIKQAMTRWVASFDWASWYSQHHYKAAPVAKGEPVELGSIDPLIDIYRSTSKDPINAALHGLHQAAAARTIATLRLPHDPADMQDAIDETFNKWSWQIAENGADDLRDMLQRNLAEEDTTPADFARNLRNEWEDLSSSQAWTIARTEYNTVASQATLKSYEANGVDYKAWITVQDDLVDDTCAENEAEGPIPIDEAFGSGDDAPPAHPNCRCNITSVINPDNALPGDFAGVEMRKSAGNTGAMVALRPVLEDADFLALPGGLAPEDLHVTLAYLGEASSLTDQQRAATLKLARAWAARVLPFTALLSWYNLFASEGGREGAVVVELGSPDLRRLQAQLVAKLRAAGVQVDATFPEFRPHLSLAYDAPAIEGAPPLREVALGSVLVELGPERYEFPLGRVAKDATFSTADLGSGGMLAPQQGLPRPRKVKLHREPIDGRIEYKLTRVEENESDG